MAFLQPIPRPFNERGIWVYAPSQSGVFGITNSREWIYVGESADIRAALLGLLGGGEPLVLQSGPTGFVFELCGAEARVDRHNRLITEYSPVCQRERPRSYMGGRA